MKSKIIILTGPTASGKTGMSLKLAKKIGCEIISADSRQVYKWLNIGTDKISNTKNIKHYLINNANPKRTYTVARWKKDTEKAIKNIIKNNKIPLIVGGTAFYIEALIGNTNIPDVKPDHALRKKLEKKSKESLLDLLEKLNPKRAKNIDLNNKRRLIRAIEIAKTLKKTSTNSEQSKNSYNALILGLKIDEKTLKSKINKRVEKRADAIIREIKQLRQKGLSFKKLISFGQEYRFYSEYLLGKIPKKEAVQKSKTAHWQYSRRQKTFFKRLPIKWIKTQSEAETKIKKFFHEN